MEFVAHLYNDPSFVGTNYMVGAAFEIAPNQIWAGQMLVTATSEVDPTGMVSFFFYCKTLSYRVMSQKQLLDK